MALHLSVKRIQISKANNRLAIIIAAAIVISVFCLISTKSLLSQASYQRRAITAKHKAADQLKTNITAAKQLVTQYQVFQDENPNIIGGIGGSNPGNGPLDGDNSRIVLDALPSQYDFPALISSIEKVLSAEHVSIQGIGGTDEGQPLTTNSSSDSQPVPILFSLDTATSYAGTKVMLLDFERSIRPMDVTSLQLSGNQDQMHVTASITTYYQPSKTFSVNQKAVK
jgi:hypothetical protein